MKVKISELKSPALAGVVRAKNVREAKAEIQNCIYSGADMIDLHLSAFEEISVESIKEIAAWSRLPILALNYNSNYYSQDSGLSEEERVRSLLSAAEAGVAGIDMQGYTFHRPSKDAFFGEDKYSFTKGSPKEVVTDDGIISKQCELIERVHSMGAEVLLSCHPGIYMNCEQVVELAFFLEKRNPDIIKIVTSNADTDEQMIEAMRTMVALKKEVRTPITFHANGKSGALTRIINPVLGGHIAFCVDRFYANSTIQQVDLRTARAVVENISKIM